MGCLFSKQIHEPKDQELKYAASDTSSSSPKCKTLHKLHDWPVLSVARNSPGKGQFFSASDRIVLYDWLKGRVVYEISHPHKDDINCLCYSESGDLLFSASRDKTIGVWKSGQRAATLTGHEFSVTALAMNEYDATTTMKQIATGSRDSTVRLWDIEKQQCIAQNKLMQNLVTGLRWLPGEHCFLQISEDLRVRIFDSRTMEPVQTGDGLAYIQTCCDVSASGDSFITGGKGFDSNAGCVMKLWDRRNMKQIKDFVGHEQTINSCCFVGSNEERIATVSNDRTVKLWDVSSGRELSSMLLELDTDGAASCIVPVPHEKAREQVLFSGFQSFLGLVDVSNGGIRPMAWSK